MTHILNTYIIHAWSEATIVIVAIHCCDTTSMPPIVPFQITTKMEIKGTVLDGSEGDKKSPKDQKVKIPTTNW